jgi:hypothetical protein
MSENTQVKAALILTSYGQSYKEYYSELQGYQIQEEVSVVVDTNAVVNPGAVAVCLRLAKSKA